MIQNDEKEDVVRRNSLFFLVFLMSILLIMPVAAQSRSRGSVKRKTAVDYPEVPRVSAYEAFRKFKAGKAIIVQSGGQKYELRHIIGAHDLNQEPVRSGKPKLPKLPSKGVEIFTFCY